MRSWIDYWNADHAIYVNGRHKALHAQNIARDIVRNVPSPNAVVLDHGCGEALYAEEVAKGCGQLILCEAAPRVCEALAQRLAGVPNVRVVEPQAVGQLTDSTIDVVIANSLLQYLSRSELEALLDLWRAKVKPGGKVVLADVIPPDVSPVRDAAALLSFASRGGFLVGALTGLVKTALSDYGKIRKELGFSMYREADITELAAAHRFKAERAHPNFGHNQARMTFVLRPA